MFFFFPHQVFGVGGGVETWFFVAASNRLHPVLHLQLALRNAVCHHPLLFYAQLKLVIADLDSEDSDLL